MPTGLHGPYLFGSKDYWQCAIVKCGRPGMASSVTEVQSYDEGRDRRSVTGVRKSVTGTQNKSVTRGMEVQQTGKEV